MDSSTGFQPILRALQIKRVDWIEIAEFSVRNLFIELTSTMLLGAPEN